MSETSEDTRALLEAIRIQMKALTIRLQARFLTVWVPSIHGLSQHEDESWSGLPWIPRELPHRVKRLSFSVVDGSLQSILKTAKK